MVKIGTNVNIACDKNKRHRLLAHPELAKLTNHLDKLIKKYSLTWKFDSDKSQFNIYSNRSLSSVASSYPDIFIDVASRMSPGGYDERRFWWCANNYAFYIKHSVNQLCDWRKNINHSSSRLLSDVYYLLLNLDEKKSISICALHMSVKYCESTIFWSRYRINRNYIMQVISENPLEKSDPGRKELLRERFKVGDAERELKQVNHLVFFDWWNLTGLRRN